MHRAARLVLAVVAMFPFSGLYGASIDLRLVADALDRPLAMAHAGDGSGRLFIVEQVGRIRVVDGSALMPTPFLDITPLVSCCQERGLLGLAFHPDYEVNGQFYVNYTDPRGDTRIVRYTVSPDPSLADPASAAVLLVIQQPFGNHNGGQLAFGPDGYLFIAVGDGGSAGDPFDNGQNGLSLLGKILRIDVDSGTPYAIPVDNPFRFDPGARDEVWATGLRNPWRFSFDRLTGDLFVADVGQNAWEEVNFEPVTSAGGNNYGWRRMEGAHCFDPQSGCGEEGFVLPILEYSHAEGCSVTGGFRYRGSQIPELFGHYVFGDFCSGRIWSATVDEGGLWTRSELLSTSLSISSFGEDEAGELYVVDLGGAVYRFERDSDIGQGELGSR
ncbi:MAG TPA: PQQ-dependent sugar dehydrogenase [Vicinamibacteria bacterium]|nr:PQQ-dependent sugar dehydrogenase [Vicinamibacteria bacterium]